MKFLLVLLAGVCVWLLVEREKLIAEGRSKQEQDTASARGSNWVQDRIKNTPRMLDVKPRPVQHRERNPSPYPARLATDLSR